MNQIYMGEPDILPASAEPAPAFRQRVERPREAIRAAISRNHDSQHFRASLCLQ